MEKRKNLIKALTFVLIFSFLFYGANRFFSAADGKGMIYEYMPEETLDVAICGASGVGTAISPCQLWDEYGIASCNNFTSAETALTCYYLFKDMLQYQKPKLIVLDASVLWYNFTVDNEYFEPFTRVAIDSMKLTDVKREAIDDIVSRSDIQSEASFYLPIIRFHESWKSLTLSNFSALLSKRSDVLEDETLGQMMYTYQDSMEPFLPVEQREVASATDAAAIPSLSQEYFDRLLGLCAKENVGVLLVRTPAIKWTAANSRVTAEYAAARGVGFVDFNSGERLEALGLDYDADFTDPLHLNVNGAKKLTHDLGEYLSAMYGIEDHRGDSRYELYDVLNEKYQVTLAGLMSGDVVQDDFEPLPDM